MSTFVPGVEPEPAVDTSSFVRYLYFGAPMASVEAARGGVIVIVTPSLLHMPNNFDRQSSSRSQFYKLIFKIKA